MLPGRFLPLLWLLSLSPLCGQEPWQDELRNFRGTVPLGAPSGFRVLSAPAVEARSKGQIPGPVTVAVVAFVEQAGKRFYLSEASHRQWVETGDPPDWIFVDGREELPPQPRLLKRGPGEDPDTGETVTIEAYEETVTVQPESRWPATPAPSTKFFPAALTAVGGDEAGNTTAFFQLFLHGNAPTSGYPFADPSFKEMSDGRMGPSIRLYSRPSLTNVVLVIAGESPVLPLLQPGLVFLAGFHEGRICSLALGGDAWSESAPVSRLGAPAFRLRDRLAFGFLATEMTGSGIPLAVTPDRVGGADYTDYELIAAMGAPFDDYSPEEFQHNWTLEISSDLSTLLLAPLYDGRGAPGMLELEGLTLDPGPTGPHPDNFSEEQFAAFGTKVPQWTDPSIFGEGWKSILKGRLGPVPALQRMPETAEGGI